MNGNGYAEDGGNDERFRYYYGNIQSIATSSAQNDSGMFEFNFRDERYLPFEGAGAISTWTLELPSAYAQFDRESITDVILHMKYTALDSGSRRQQAVALIDEVLETIPNNADAPLRRLFSVKHEFATQWAAASSGNPNATEISVAIPLTKEHFPHLVQRKDIKLKAAHCFLRLSDPEGAGVSVSGILTSQPAGNGTTLTPFSKVQGIWTAVLSVDLQVALAGSDAQKVLYLKLKNVGSSVAVQHLLRDCYLLLDYHLDS
jgi:hypothetical protein